MPRRLSSLHARAIRHATEDGSRVEEALRTVVGDAPITRSASQGHFGNQLEVLESVLEDEARILSVLGRMDSGDRTVIASTLEARTDSSCHVFMRLDKQRAYKGELRLSDGDDVIAVRVKVRAFPAKPEVAMRVMRDVLEGLSGESD